MRPLSHDSAVYYAFVLALAGASPLAVANPCNASQPSTHGRARAREQEHLASPAACISPLSSFDRWNSCVSPQHSALAHAGSPRPITSKVPPFTPLAESVTHGLATALNRRDGSDPTNGRPGSTPHALRGSIRAYRSSSSAHRHGRAAPGRCGCRTHPRATGSQTNDGKCGSRRASQCEPGTPPPLPPAAARTHAGGTGAPLPCAGARSAPMPERPIARPNRWERLDTSGRAHLARLAVDLLLQNTGGEDGTTMPSDQAMR